MLKTGTRDFLFDPKKKGFGMSDWRDVALNPTLSSFQGPWLKMLNTRTHDFFGDPEKKGSVWVGGGRYGAYTASPNSRQTHFPGAMPRGKSYIY